MNIAVLILAIIFGLIVGSFLNVCICRMPGSRSVVNPPSHCPRCKHAIAWYDNIPVLSFIILGARCRYCKERISPRYMIVELLTAGVFVLFLSQLGVGISSFSYIVLACGMIVATFIDFEHQIIPDEITYGGMVLGLLLSLLFPQLHGASGRLRSLLASGLGLLAGGLLIYLTGVLGKFMFKKEAMGGGDVKFLAMIGAFVGLKYVVLIYFIAPFFGAGVGLIMKIKYKAEIIPYGPYLSLAAVVAILWGNDILRFIQGG
ncbi:MAG: prepilin peptidase [Candidatus Omnitrophica bacterium]|nr:prepilin peptidase [Candidatus Omnitrophota bacterium]